MSEKKSWDVVRKAPAQPYAPAKRAPAKPLREQRKKKRRMFWVVLCMLLAALVAGALYVLWLPAVRVSEVHAQGPDAEGVQQVALNSITGMYWFGVPRNSIFMLPDAQVRAQILKTYPDIDAVSIKPESLHSLLITSTPRAAAFVWCGSNIDALPASGQCFSADAAGLIFAPIDASSTDASSSLRIFAPLDRDVAADASPIRSYVVASKQIPDALRLVKALRNLGAPVSALAISGDEGDFYLQGPTKVKYVLGHEEQAAELAASTFPKLNLTDGSIDYIDLRFVTAPGQPGKVYVKKFGE